MSNLDKMLERQSDTLAPQVSAAAAIRALAANRELKTFLIAICRYSKADWARMLRNVKALYAFVQSSLLVKSDSNIMDELVKVPHIAFFFRRLTEEDT